MSQPLQSMNLQEGLQANTYEKTTGPSPGGPVVGDKGSVPGWGTEVQHATMNNPPPSQKNYNISIEKGKVLLQSIRLARFKHQ